MPQQWYAGGPSRRKLETIAVNAFREFGASMYLDPNPRPPAGDLGAFFRGVPGVATSEFYHYFHTDAGDARRRCRGPASRRRRAPTRRSSTR